MHDDNRKVWSQERLIALMSHELRTPLNGIIGTASLLRDTSLQPDQRTYVDTIRNSASQLLELLNNVLDFARLKDGAPVSLDSKPVSPLELAQEVCELLSPRAHDKGIDLATCALPGAPTLVETDPVRLRQILFNLVGNALKFTDRGGVLVEVSRGETPGSVDITVRDTGPGIDAASRDTLFEAFRQVHADDMMKDSGVGLGLAIVRHLLDLLGGTIAVDSDGQRGTAFRVTLPKASAECDISTDRRPMRVELRGFGEVTTWSIASRLIALGHMPVLPQDGQSDTGAHVRLASAALAQSELRHVSSLGPTLVVIRPEDRALLPKFRDLGCSGYLVQPVRAVSLSEQLREAASGKSVSGRDERVEISTEVGGSVLVADDNSVNALIARRALEKTGFVVSVVGTGREAVDAVRAGSFALVLMDLRMPVMNGFEAMQAIRSDGFTDLPVIAVSADISPEIERRARACGANAVAAKPLEAETLITLARKWARIQGLAA